MTQRGGSRWRSSAVALAIAVVLTALIAALATPAGATAGAPAGATAGATTGPAVHAVSVGTRPGLPAGAAELGPLPATTKLDVTLALQPSDPAALEAYATAVSTPGNPLFGQYLTPGQFAGRFGSSPAAISALTSDMTAEGFSVSVSPDHLAVRLAGVESQYARAFGTTFQQYRLAGGRLAYANQSAPELSSAVALDVQAVIGLDDLTQERAQPIAGRRATPLPASQTGAAPKTDRPQIASTEGPQPCLAAQRTAAEFSGYTADQIAAAYDFNPLYAAGDLGAGQTVALFELEPYADTDIQAFQSCYGTSASVTAVPVDDYSVTGSGSGESALDIENVIAVAPDATVLVYEDDPNNGNAAYDLWNAIIGQDQAKVVTTSWGECEAFEGKQFAQALNTLFEEAATQGQSVIDADGDSGSADCFNTLSTDPDTSLAVDDPAAQPFATAVGGTTLEAIGPSPSETTWDDQVGRTGAGGGGISSFWPMPAYQRSPAYRRSVPGVINRYSSGVPCGAAAGTDCREVPDVSLDADPNTGYVNYYMGSYGVVGGTSGAAPTLAGLVALANASSSCAGHDVGFINPRLYQSAARAYSSDFNDITTGNNDWIGVNNGLYPSTSGYDMATGLGSPIGAALVVGLCEESPVFTADSPPLKATPRSVYSYTFRANAYPAPSFALGSGAPSFLHINSTTGQVTGTLPQGQPSFTYTVVAGNGVAPNAVAGPFTVVTTGYWLAGANGAVFGYGDAINYGGLTQIHLAKPIVGMAPTPDGKGYWLVASDGGIFTFGDAHFYGSTGNVNLNKPIVGIATTPDGKGYWLVASDGGIFTFGDAHFYGSTGNVNLNKPIVGTATTPDGKGYWLVASDGGIFTFGDAHFYGSTGNVNLNKPIVGTATTPDGKGYWLVASDGGIFTFGDAHFYGSTGNVNLNKPIVGTATTPDGKGYWLVASDGGIFTFGDAHFYGSTGGIALGAPITQVAPTR